MRSMRFAAAVLVSAALMGCQSMGMRNAESGGAQEKITHSTATGPGSIRHQGGTDMVRTPVQIRMAEAPPPPPPAPEPEVSAFEAPECTIYFDFDEAEIRADQRETLDACGRFYRDNMPQQLRLEGHADERGPEAYNMNLGRARALSVQEALIAMGVPGNRITIVSYGENRPAVRGSGESAWSRNRRVEFVTQ